MRWQVRSDTVTGAASLPLNCDNTGQLRLCRVVRSVRIEGVRGSNPLSSTQFLLVTGMISIDVMFSAVDMSDSGSRMSDSGSRSWHCPVPVPGSGAERFALAAP
jgi:hypothetical protein